MNPDTIVKMQRLLATIHTQASGLWLMTRNPDMVMARTEDIDEQYSTVAEAIVELQAMFDGALDDACAKHKPQLDPRDGKLTLVKKGTDDA